MNYLVLIWGTVKIFGLYSVELIALVLGIRIIIWILEVIEKH